jgi:DNA ligase 1
MQRRSLLTWLLLTFGSMAQAAPPLMLANVYRRGMPLAGYWISEKYDGVRGYWDGEKLLTRGGEIIVTPPWFTEGWPRIPMDGELWAGRGSFAEAVSTVRQLRPDDRAWRAMRFMVFDLPAHGGVFTERIVAYQELLVKLALPWVLPVDQKRATDHAALQALLHRTVRAGGEGLMLHRGDAPYRASRNDDLLKVKTHDDAEARVIAHLPGKGRLAGQTGALLVETPDGLRFRLGTGLRDADHQNPPGIGRWITYRYRGKNASGVPRFASFLRVRDDFRP